MARFSFPSPPDAPVCTRTRLGSGPLLCGLGCGCERHLGASSPPPPSGRAPSPPPPGGLDAPPSPPPTLGCLGTPPTLGGLGTPLPPTHMPLGATMRVPFSVPGAPLLPFLAMPAVQNTSVCWVPRITLPTDQSCPSCYPWNTSYAQAMEDEINRRVNDIVSARRAVDRMEDARRTVDRMAKERARDKHGVKKRPAPKK